MKKILVVLLAAFSLSMASFAQTKPVEKAKAPAAKTAAAPVKKDGTPDMRFKANKEAAKAATPAGPLKKDGTPDMRHKANKEAAKKKGA
jgi:uncharacterized protein involved in copper resistance